MFDSMRTHLSRQLDEIRGAGLFKQERVITTPQSAHIRVETERAGDLLNMCANNYLGLANHPELVKAAQEALDRWGYGLASVRFICGTQQIHKRLEAHLSEFLATEDSILYTSCFDANGGLFETLLGKRTASSATRSTMPASSTVSACARRSGCVMRTATCPIWRSSFGAPGRAASA